MAIGASVLNADLIEQGNFFVTNYRPGITIFEERCWAEFWSKHPETLQKLEYQGEASEAMQEVMMIEDFQEFRRHWEMVARESKCKLELVSDNNVYDGGFINDLICKHTHDLPIPYTATRPQTYAAFWETHSIQKGVLAMVDPGFTKNWGFSKRLADLFVIPPQTKEHNHLPHHDAYTIAFDYQVIKGIQAGRIPRRL